METKTIHQATASLLEQDDREVSFRDQPKVERVYLSKSPYAGAEWQPYQPGLWPARWISHPLTHGDGGPVVAAYRLDVSLAEALEMEFHITADERYELYLDGDLIGRGAELGDPEHWFFESYQAFLPAGEHRLVVIVWSQGEKAAYAQMSLRHGFFFCPGDARLLNQFATGSAAWQCMIVSGYDWQSPAAAWGTGWNLVIDAARFPWGIESGEGDAWVEPETGTYGDSAEGLRSASYHSTTAPLHRLCPATLQPMIERPLRGGVVRHIAAFAERPVGLKPVLADEHIAAESPTWQHLLDADEDCSLEIAPYTRRRIVIDLEAYACLRPEVLFSGGKGGRIDVGWAEAPYLDFGDEAADRRRVWAKGNRDEIEGKHFISPWHRCDLPGDTLYPDGGALRRFRSLWWHAGRYAQILVETAAEPLTIHRLRWYETRYPLEMEGTLEVSDPGIQSLFPMMLRGLQACAHEVYMDCPYYEQLMYIGDTRLQILCTYAISQDDRLAKKALQLFNWARLPSGMTPSRYPSRTRQIIPPFSFWWVAMCHDYALWREDESFLRTLLPGVRATCDAFAACIDSQGLLKAPEGWNFMDWAGEGWALGVPPDGNGGYSGVLNWHAAWMFRLASELEEWFGEPEIAEMQRRRSRLIAGAAHDHFWNPQRGMYADDLAHSQWSEHTQCMAILSEAMPEAYLETVVSGLLEGTGLVRASIYFTHYLFEAYRKARRVDAFFKRLDLWKGLISLGLKTPIESPEPSRSDCHAWGSHPLYHFYATVAGIRPADVGFRTIAFDPQMVSSGAIRGSMPHPRGMIFFEIDGDRAEIVPPAGVCVERAISTGGI